MFIEYFGFTENPFNLAADATFFCLDYNRQKLCQQILKNLQSDSKPVIITGQLGVGKSQLIHYVLSLLPEQLQALQLSDGSITYSERIRLLIAKSAELINNGKKLVVIINNAHEIPAQDLILLLHGIKSLGQDKSPIQFIFSGLSELSAKLIETDGQLFSEANTHVYGLAGLNEPQVADYVKFRLQRAGYSAETNGDLFTGAAIKAIANLSHGIPHSINLLCGASLLVACFDNKRQVTHSIVQEASLSCLLPVEIESKGQVINFPQVLPKQSKITGFARRGALQRRQFNQRMSNWKRLVPIQQSLPVTISVSERAEITHAKRKRLVRGVMALSVSLSFLIGLQHMASPVNPPIMVSQIKPVVEFSSQQIIGLNKPELVAVNPVQAEISKSVTNVWSAKAAAESSRFPKHTDREQLLATNTAKVNKSVPKPSVQLSKANFPAQQNASVKVSKTIKDNTYAESTKASTAIRLAKLDVERTINKAQLAQTLKTELAAHKISASKPSFKQVSANLSEFIGEPEIAYIPPVNRYIDAQELAAKNRAASRLNLDKLGIEYSVKSLMTAARTGDLLVLKLLLNGGIPPDIKDNQGETALISAARNGYKSVVKELLSKGAHPNVKDKNGLTALMHANQVHRTDISSILLNHGGRG